MASSDEDDQGPCGGGGDGGGLSVVELSFCVFPSLKPAGQAPSEQVDSQVYVPWEAQAPPWRRLAKFVRKKYMVGLLARGRPAVAVIQTNHAPEHPNRSSQRSKDLLSWAAKELSVVGAVRLVLRVRVQGVGFTMSQQADAAEEMDATEAVHAFLAEMGEDKSTADAVIACFKGAEFEPGSWLPQLIGLRDEAEEEDWTDGEEAGEEGEEGEEPQQLQEEAAAEEEAEEGSGSPLLEFIQGVKAQAAIDEAAKPKADDKPDPKETETEPELEPEPKNDGEAAAAAAEAAAAAAREQLRERATAATRVMEEGRGLGLATREELRDLLQRCHTAGADIVRASQKSPPERWEGWEEMLWAAEPEAECEPEEQPPPGMSAKERKKWEKKQQKRLARAATGG